MTQEILNQARILIVDDQETNIALLEDILQSAGYTNLRGLTDPREVAKTYEEFQPDLILLDLLMPYMDGVAVMEKLWPTVPEGTYLPILVLTADVTAQAKKRALTAGAKDFLTKPFDEDEVLLRIKNLLETRFLYLQQQQQASARIQELATLIDRANDAIVLLDMQDRITFWNRGAETIFGWTGAEAIGRDAYDLLVKQAPSRLREAQQTLLNTGQWSGEVPMTAKDGKERLLGCRWTLMANEGGQAKSRLWIATDITEKKKLEEQLLRAQRLESIGVLAGGIAHDLNNVLTPIMMSVQLFALKLTDPASQSLLKNLEASVQRGADMVKQILTFARGTNGERQPLLLEPVVKELAKIVKQSFPKNIEVNATVPKGLRLVLGDSTQLYQVLMNLCVNARDAMPKGGRLTVAVENLHLDEQYARQEPQAHPGPYVLIKVSDSGSGMTAEVLDRIFEPFFTTKEQGQGTGLGLSVAQGIIKSHGGFIKVDSQVGQGTEFHIYLPALETRQLKQAEEKLPLPSGHGELILVADDEAAIAAITRATLEAYGYRVLTAADGAEATALFSQHQKETALALIDMMMPLMDGPATIRALRHLNPALKIIATSGLATGKQAAEAFGDGAITFLRKPFTAAELLTVLQEVLRRS